MTTEPQLYRGEAVCKRWSDSSTSGRTVTFQIGDDGPHPFRGYEGERFALVVVALGNDEKPMVKEPSPQSAGGHAMAAALSPDERSAIASKAAKRRWHDMPPSQRAALLTKDPEFWKFADVESEVDADVWLKEALGITSKSQLDRADLAAIKQHFERTEGNFQAWRQAKQHGAIS